MIEKNEVIRSLVNLLDSEVGKDIIPVLAKTLGFQPPIMELTAKEYLLMKNNQKLSAVKSVKNRLNMELLEAKNFCEIEFQKLEDE